MADAEGSDNPMDEERFGGLPQHEVMAQTSARITFHPTSTLLRPTSSPSLHPSVQAHHKLTRAPTPPRQTIMTNEKNRGF